MDPDSEAMKVSRKIFRTMNEQAKNEGKEFIVFILPTMNHVTRYHSSRAYRNSWDSMILSIIGDQITSVDLMKDFITLPPEQYDKSHDGMHYGKKMNERLADLMAKYLRVKSNEKGFP